MLARLGIGEILVIGAAAFLIFGPQKLPDLGRSFGETVRNFKDGISGLTDEVNESETEIEIEGKI